MKEPKTTSQKIGVVINEVIVILLQILIITVLVLVIVTAWAFIAELIKNHF